MSCCSPVTIALFYSAARKAPPVRNGSVSISMVCEHRHHREEVFHLDRPSRAMALTDLVWVLMNAMPAPLDLRANRGLFGIHYWRVEPSQHPLRHVASPLRHIYIVKHGVGVRAQLSPPFARTAAVIPNSCSPLEKRLLSKPFPSGCDCRNMYAGELCHLIALLARACSPGRPARRFIATSHGRRLASSTSYHHAASFIFMCSPSWYSAMATSTLIPFQLIATAHPLGDDRWKTSPHRTVQGYTAIASADHRPRRHRRWHRHSIMARIPRAAAPAD